MPRVLSRLYPMSLVPWHRAVFTWRKRCFFLIILNIFFGQSVLGVLLFSDGQGDEASEMTPELTLSDKEATGEDGGRGGGGVWPGQRGHRELGGKNMFRDLIRVI